MALQVACCAGVIVRVQVIQSREGGVGSAIRAVPQKRLVNPFSREADGIAPAVVVPDFGDSAVRCHQRPHMSQPVDHIVAGVGGVL